MLHKEIEGKKMQVPTLGADKVMTNAHSLKKTLCTQYNTPVCKTYYVAIR